MQKFMNTGLATVAAAALAIGILGAPQAAKAETCALVKSGNAFSINATDNTFNPTTNSTGATSGTNLACGDGTVVTGTNATAVGGSATAAQDGTAIGQGSSVTGAGSVALGQGSTDGGVANVVSVGAVGSERRVINVAAGTNGTDAVNVNQLNVVASTANIALTNSATALTNSSTALTAATTAQSTANTALANAATAQAAANAATASIASVQTMVTSQAATITSIQALNATQTSQISALTAGQTALSNQIISNNKAANGGIAAAMAMGGTVMPSDANFALSFNVSTYRGQQGFSGTAVARVSEKVYFSAGVAGSTAKGSTGGRAGVTFAW